MKHFFSAFVFLALSTCLFGQAYETTLKYEIARGTTADTMKVFMTNNTASNAWLGGVHWGIKLSTASAVTTGVPETINDDLDEVLRAGPLKTPEFQEYTDTDVSVNPPVAVNSVTIDGVTYDTRLDFTTSPGLAVILGGGPLFLLPTGGTPVHMLDFVIERANPATPVDMILEASNDINNNFLTNSVTPVGVIGVNLTDFDVEPLSTSFPVELLDFDAYQVGEGAVQLDWTTATEVNNAEFQIERSMDSRLFEQIGTVAGAGNTNSPRDYDFMDFSAPEAKIYYRLRQVDFDGTFTYSPVREVRLGNAFAPRFDIFPNPARNYVNVEAAVSSERNFDVRILDMTGRIVFEEKNVSLGEEKYQIDISRLVPANYVMELIDSMQELKHSEMFIVIE